jgi:hypothetical protein
MISSGARHASPPRRKQSHIPPGCSKVATTINTPAATSANPHYLRNRTNGPASSAITAPAAVLLNLSRGIWKWCMSLGECARTSPEQPGGYQHRQYYGGKLGHVAGIGAIQ